MITAWTKNLRDPSEVSKFEDSVKHSNVVLDRLAEIIKEYDTEITNKEINPDIYSTPNWDYLQAHNNGAKAAYNKMLKIINSRP